MRVLVLLTVAAALQPGPLLRPSQTPGRFDSAAVVNPVVLPPTEGDPLWRMLYYGTSGAWADPAAKPFLPTGACGLATSPDGVAWRRVDGERADAAVFGPADDLDAWDGLHVGVGDVVRQHWRTYGRNYYSRYDYETVDSGAAHQMVQRLLVLITI